MTKNHKSTCKVNKKINTKERESEFRFNKKKKKKEPEIYLICRKTLIEKIFILI